MIRWPTKRNLPDPESSLIVGTRSKRTLVVLPFVWTAIPKFDLESSLMVASGSKRMQAVLSFVWTAIPTFDLESGLIVGTESKRTLHTYGHWGCGAHCASSRW